MQEAAKSFEDADVKQLQAVFAGQGDWDLARCLL